MLRYVAGMDVVRRLNVRFAGPEDGAPMVFAHGFGCDQQMWRHVAPAYADEFRVITFDYPGAGGADLAGYDRERLTTLEGYADVLLSVVRELDLRDVVFVGHSVSAMVGVMAQLAEPERFAKLVLVAPSPRYVDDGDYVGGFAREDVDDLLDSLAGNYLGWSAQMAPVVVGNADRPELGQELTAAFCRMDPDVARRFARATFLGDTRAELPRVTAPTLVLQCSEDVIAPLAVGQYVARSIPQARLVLLRATGHCPNLSAPAETIEAIDSFVRAA